MADAVATQAPRAVDAPHRRRPPHLPAPAGAADVRQQPHGGRRPGADRAHRLDRHRRAAPGAARPARSERQRPLAPPSREYPLGRDDKGRDILSRVIYGTRIALKVGLFSVLLGGVLGTAIGVAAAYFGGKIDTR